MRDAQLPGDERVLRGDDVGVVVARELRVQTVARLARLSRADGIGNDDEVRVAVEELPLLEELAGEIRNKKVGARAAGAVEEQYRIADDAAGVADRRTDRSVVDAQFGQHRAG